MIEQNVKQVLSEVNDPELNTYLITLDFLRNTTINGDILKLEIALNNPSSEKNESLKDEIINKIKNSAENISDVEINFVQGITSDSERKKSSLMPGVKNTIAVASGKGGVGKSTVAVNLAAALTQAGARVGIIDADIYGPSIPIMLGIDTRPGMQEVDGKNKLVPVTQFKIKVMSIGFLIEKGQAVVWRGPMASSALKQFMSDVIWGELDFLLFDMPPGTGDIQLTLSQTLPLTGAVIVTTPQEISLADARKGHLMFEKVDVPALGFIENMSYYLMKDGSKDYIFGSGGGKKISDEFNTELLGEIPIVTDIRESGDAGMPIVISKPDSEVSKTYNDIARKLITKINKLNLESSSSELSIDV